MPSITTYSPYETLAFFQSVARHGSSTLALRDISTRLKQNEHIRDRADFDIERFSSDALQGLYDQYLGLQNGRKDSRLNGGVETGERSPKRRKLSDSMQSQNEMSADDLRQLQDVLDRSYAKYKEEAIRDIKQEEEVCMRLQEEIKKLELQVTLEVEQQSKDQVQKSSAIQTESNGSESVVPNESNASKPLRSTSQTTIQSQNKKPSVTIETGSMSISGNNTPNVTDHKPKSPPSREASVLPSPNPPAARPSQPPTPVSNQHPSPGTFAQQMPSQQLSRPAFGHIQPQPMYPPPQAPGGHVTAHTGGTQPKAHGRGQQPGNGRGSPMPYQGQHLYAQYPPYPPPPPQWHPHNSPQPYQQHTAYGPPPQYYPQPSNTRHPQTPQQIPYPPYPHTAPVHYMQQQPQQWRNQAWPIHPVSAISTPISRPESRLSMPGSSSSTPWRRRQQSGQPRSRSPPRPEREVSPLTDGEDSPVPSKVARERETKGPTKVEKEPINSRYSRRTERPRSITPSAAGPSRSQSIASRASDVQHEKQMLSRRSQKIKAEPPSTPLPVPAFDTDQRSSGRRGRPRSDTVTSQADGLLRATTIKRKRDSVSSLSPGPSPKPVFATPSSRRIDQSYDPSLVIVSKNFARTSQLLLNEITSHKLAGIFAKPLSERDAPGYKDLIYRPQDLKAIKAAVSKGGRAALAAVEILESDPDTTPNRSQNATQQSSMARAIGNGFYLVPKTSDLVPPKGIVNSGQLEMELVRMFANAVMFNPLPMSERGFGRSLRLRKNGGDINVGADSAEPSVSEESENSSTSEIDEDGIISDTREMFHDVIETVSKWRELEGERMGAGADVSVSRHGSLAVPTLLTTEGARHTSVSASSNIGDDDPTAGENEDASTPVPHSTTGPGRKRRRIAEN